MVLAEDVPFQGHPFVFIKFADGTILETVVETQNMRAGQTFAVGPRKACQSFQGAVHENDLLFLADEANSSWDFIQSGKEINLRIFHEHLQRGFGDVERFKLKHFVSF